jgi:hypothetical protein
MIALERRRAIPISELLARVGLIWLIVSVIFVINKWQVISGMAVPTTDNAVFMVPLHILPGGALAQEIALVILPLLIMGAAMLLAGQLAWRLFDSELASYTVLTLALAIPVVGQFQPLRIDHHSWQMVAVFAALNGLTARSARCGGWVSGVALGLGLSVSLELLPVTLLCGLILTLRWLVQPVERAWLVHFLWAIALTSLVTFALTSEIGGLSGSCSTIVSATLLAGFGSAAAGASLLCLAPRMPRLPLLLALGMVGAAALTIGMTVAQQCVAEPLARPDAALHLVGNRPMFAAMPAWSFGPAMFAQMMVPPLIGLIAALRLHHRCCAWLRRFWLEYSLLLTGSLVISIFDARASGLACAIAAVPLAWQLRMWLRAAQKMRGPVARVPAFSAMALAVIPGLPLMVFASLSVS